MRAPYGEVYVNLSAVGLDVYLNSNKQIDYINGIKGLACIGIVVGHYAGIYKYAETIPPAPRLADILFRHPLWITIDENFWLCVFCVLSGYVVAIAHITDFRSLISKIIKRFLRLYLPMLGACIIIYGLYKLFGFSNIHTTKLFHNNWFQSFYTTSFGIAQVFTDPAVTLLYRGSPFNNVYWMLNSLFMSSIIIYVGRYVLSYRSSARIAVHAVTLYLCIRYYGFVGFGCALGALILDYQPQLVQIFARERRHRICWGIFVFIMVDNGHMMLDRFMPFSFLHYTPFWKVFYFGVALLIIGNSATIKQIFSHRLLQSLNRISFGVYSLHFPIICTMTCALFLHSKWSFMNFILFGLLTMVVIIAASWLYHYAVEIPASRLLKRLP